MSADHSRVFFRLNPLDRLGRKIDPTVLAAAQEVLPRALEHGVNLLGDPAVVTNILEEVAAEVSRLVASKEPPGEPVPIQNLAGYVFRGFVRRVNRLKRKELILVSDGDGQPLTSRWADPSRQFETKILVDECLAHCDFVTRDMFWRRVQGLSWGEIGKIHGLSGHAAEVRFRHALRRVQVRLTNGRRSLPYTTRADGTDYLKSAMRTDAEKKRKGI